MEYETSYDIGSRPFIHDKNRGKWESPKDFVFTCVGHAFKLDSMTILPLLIFEMFGIYALIPYFLILAVCVVPIVYIQSFLGQFSSTGYISVFRIAPFFKGLGYVSLVVNFITLTYYSVFTSIPLLYFVHSLSPTIPWSCQGAEEWMNDTRSDICVKKEFYKYKNPGVEFFKNHFKIKTYGNISTLVFSWEMAFYTIVVYSVVTLMVLQSTERIGKFSRYAFYTIIGIMSICLIRFLFLPQAIQGVFEFFRPDQAAMVKDLSFWILIPVLVFSVMGPGWSSILTMASYNDFKANIYKYSWIINLTQLLVIIGMALMSISLRYFMLRDGSENSVGIVHVSNFEWTSFLPIASSLTFLEFPNMWSLLFFGMLVLGSLNLMVIQLFSLLTSIFDEFENIREIKKHVTLGIVGFLMLASMFFCTNHGVFFFEVLAKLSLLTQVIMNFLLLFVVLWIYGRERFQRDLNFMTSQVFSTWMVYVVRFVTPVLLAIGFVIGFMYFVFTLIFHPYSPSIGGELIILGLFIYILPWCLIPTFCFIKINQTIGSTWTRFKKLLRPTDWYPADPVYKQSYEERFSCTNISHPLTVISDDSY